LTAGVSAWISNWVSLPARAAVGEEAEEGFKRACLWRCPARRGGVEGTPFELTCPPREPASNMQGLAWSGIET
jgi:hypothetical protein